MRKFLVVCLTAALVACGGGGGGAGGNPGAGGPGAGGPPSQGTTVYGTLTASERALLGTDADGDGVRDDVDAWIAATYTDPAARAAAVVAAQWDTWAMIRGSRGTATTQAELHQWESAQDCFDMRVINAMGDKAPSSHDWAATLFNTHDRTKAYLTWDASTDGQYSLGTTTPCNEIGALTTP